MVVKDLSLHKLFTYSRHSARIMQGRAQLIDDSETQY